MKTTDTSEVPLAKKQANTRDKTSALLTTKLRKTGYSMIELLTALAIMAIAASYASPILQDSLRSYEANRYYRTMLPMLTAARSQATLGFSDVLLCGTLDRQNCADDWSNGILIFMDTDADRTYDPSKDTLHEYANPNLRYGRIVVKASRGETKVWFKRNTGNSLGFNGSMYYCGQQGKYHRGIILSGAAMLRPTADKNKDGIHEDVDGKPLTQLCGN